MVRLARPGRPRLAVGAGCVVLGLLGCARFGFERLPGDEDALDASLGPVTSLDGGVIWPGAGGGADAPDGGSGGDAGGPGGGGGSGGDAGGGFGGFGGFGGEPGDAGDAGSSGGSGGFGGSGGLGGFGGVAGSAGNGGSSGSGAVAQCSQLGAFGSPVRVGGLPTTMAIGPALSDDGLTLLFGSGGSQFDVFMATRPNRTSTSFGNVTALGTVNTSGTEATPFLADGGLTLLLATDRPNTDGLNDLQVATRASLGDAFGTPTRIANVNSNATELAPQLSSDGLRLYFSSDRSNADRDIYMASRAARSDTFGTPARVSGLNTTNDEFGPTLGADELEVFIASDRSGGSGSMDIWRAVRASIGDAFGQPVNLSVVNTSGYDTDPRLSPDGTELFFASSQGGSGQGSLVLWVATRPCLDP